MEVKNFDDLVKWSKMRGAKVCTDDDMDKSVKWAQQKLRREPIPFDYFYYGIIIFIIVMVIILILVFYYNMKPNTKDIDAMNSDKNKMSSVDIVESDVEYDEDGNEIQYGDD